MTTPESLLGKELNEFVLVEYIACGAMGLVYKAKDTKMDRPVALKLVSKMTDLAPAMAEARRRLKNEAQAAGRLTHPNIVTVHGWGETEDFLYICMEYVSGRTLTEILQEEKIMPPREALPLFEQILMALEAAAAEQIVHRDIKPTNIMVMKDNRVKVMDFGIAKLPSMHLTVTGTVLGTPYYMSPEQISGRNVDIRSDIFSLGAVLYQVLTGEKPFEGESTAVLTYKIMHTNPIPPRELNVHIPEPLEKICLKALVKDPGLRYQSPSEMLKDLRSLMRMGPTAVHEPDMDQTVFGPTASGVGKIQEPPFQAQSFAYGSPTEPDALPSTRTAREEPQSGEAEILPEKSWRPSKRVVVGLTLALITALGGGMAVIKFRKVLQPPQIASKDDVIQDDSGEKRSPKSTETASPSLPTATVQPGMSVEDLIHQAETLATSNPSHARKLLEDAISLDPNHLKAVLALANLLDQNKDFAAAMEQYKNALRINSKDPGVNFRLASLYLDQGNYDEALKYFESCKTLSPMNRDEVLTNLGIIYTAKKDLFKAQDYFKKALDANKKNETAHRLLSESVSQMTAEAKEQMQTNPDKAQKMLKRAISLDADNFEANFQLARLLTLKKDYSGAIQEYLKLLSHNKESPDVYFNLGQVYMGLGNYDRAILCYESCRKLSPTYQDEVLTNLGICYYKKNNHSRAQALFKEAVKLNPNHETAGMYLKKLER